ncbi:MAG: tetratricopeptide repeat protein [Candidatus Methylumidiphilus sp.]
MLQKIFLIFFISVLIACSNSYITPPEKKAHSVVNSRAYNLGFKETVNNIVAFLKSPEGVKMWLKDGGNDPELEVSEPTPDGFVITIENIALDNRYANCGAKLTSRIEPNTSKIIIKIIPKESTSIVNINANYLYISKGASGTSSVYAGGTYNSYGVKTSSNYLGEVSRGHDDVYHCESTGILENLIFDSIHGKAIISSTATLDSVKDLSLGGLIIRRASGYSPVFSGRKSKNDYIAGEKKLEAELTNATKHDIAAWEKAAQQQEQHYDMMFRDQAQLCLGSAYAMGYGVSKNEKTAFKWFKKAAEERQNKIAKYNIGVMYAEGLGVKKNAVEAIEWFQDIAKDNTKYNGDVALAKNNLAYMYAKGLGVTKDEVKAIVLFQDAVEIGNSITIPLRNLGFIYEQGLGVQKDELNAFIYYSAAARSGDSMSLQNANSIEKRLTPEQLDKANAALEAFE